MRGLVLRWAISAGAILLVAQVIKGIQVEGVLAAFVAAAVLGIVNAVLRPVLLLVTLPLNLLTLGLLTFLINGLMLYLAGKVVEGFTVTGFWSAVFGALFISIISGIASALIGESGRIEIVYSRR